MGVAVANVIDDDFIERFARSYSPAILESLLCDRTTGRNIIWADNEYETLGDGYYGDDEITVDKITGPNAGVIKPRIAKELGQRSQRTKTRAEVFSPSWLCNQMNNDFDEVWFGRRDVFNVEDDQSWEVKQEPIEFPKGKKGCGWHAYVEAPELEITCGEAPFVCSRYDAVTGDKLAVRERVGFLDRKLRVVSEKTKTRKEWVRRALDALRASYGFEYQGDNLLIARINVFETFVEHFHDRWGGVPTLEELDQAAWIVSWNFWQMNGLNDAVPTNKMDVEIESTLGTFEEPELQPIQTSLFDLFDDVFLDETTKESDEEQPKETVPLCVLYDWRNGEPFELASLKGKASAMGKKFYAVIGNPPYQMESKGDNNSDTPVYHYFYNSSYDVADKVELITPARFLFRAGSTPSAWNEKMLNDECVKVEKYYPSSKDVFADVDIKGGVAIVYRDSKADFGAIGFFSRYEQLSGIIKRIKPFLSESVSSIFFNRGLYRYSDLAYREHPEEMKQTSDSRVAPSSFDRMPALFTDEMPEDGHEYVKVLGRANSGRVYRYFRRDYLKPVNNLDCFKTIISKASGTGAFGETLSVPVIGEPGTAYTETYVSMGEFATRGEAEALAKYIKTKTARTLMGALKVTQNIAKPIWQFVPLQDFTPNSDIDWSQSIADIDRQLYAKYDLDDEEIEFIESHVKEMS